MIRYLISLSNNPILFKKVCQSIENHFNKNINNKEFLVDVDGSTIQVFIIGEKEVIIYDDYDYQEVYIKTDIELDSFLDEYIIKRTG